MRSVAFLVAAGALLTGSLQVVGRSEPRNEITQAAAPVLLATPIVYDSVRYKAEYLRHLDAVAAQLARERAVARARREARARARARAVARAEAAAARQPRPSGGLVVGDSVSLGAQRCLAPLGYELDSEVGRQFTVGLQRLRVHAAEGFPETVVVHLGTNGPFGEDGFHEVMSMLGTRRRVVWVTIHLPDRAPYGFRDSLNAMIERLSAGYGNVRVADFAATSDSHPEWFYSDGVHINSAGCAGYADVVDEAVTDPVG